MRCLDLLNGLRQSSLVAIAVTAVAAGAATMSAPAAAEGKLNIYNWGDYINPDVLTRFTEETGIEVTLDTYGTNEEMLAKIQAGATGYDIVLGDLMGLRAGWRRN